MSDVKWIKICTGLFDDEKILLIEGMDNADAIIIIWLKLLCMAGKLNNSGVFKMREGMPYTADMLATIFKRPVNIVKEALDVFERFGMIKTVDGIITVPNWEKHQNIDGLEKIREDTRNRVQRYRERRKEAEESEQNETQKDDEKSCNVTVTLCNATEKKRKEKNRIYLTHCAPAHAYAREKQKICENVFLYPEEWDELVKEYGEQGANELADILSAHKLKKGVTYESDYGAIKDWVIERYERRKNETRKVRTPEERKREDEEADELNAIMRFREIVKAKQERE